MSLALIAMLPQLIAAGLATEQQVVGIIRSFHPGMSDAEVNAVLQLVIDGATKHKQLADEDLAAAAAQNAKKAGG